MDKCNLDFLEKTVNRFSDEELNTLQAYCDLFDTSLDEICYLVFKELSEMYNKSYSYECMLLNRAIQRLLCPGGAL